MDKSFINIKNNLLIDSLTSDNSNNENSLLIDQTFFKDFFEEKDNEKVSPKKTSVKGIENTINILEDTNFLKISNILNENSSNKDNNNKVELLQSTPIHKLSNSLNIQNEIDDNNYETDKFGKESIYSKKISSNDKIDIFSKNNYINMSPPSQPGFKHLNYSKVDDDIDTKIDKIFNSKQDLFSQTNSNSDNKIENTNVNDFKVDENKFNKFSIFNNEKSINSSFERIKKLNSLFNNEIEKKKKKSDEKITIINETEMYNLGDSYGNENLKDSNSCLIDLENISLIYENKDIDEENNILNINSSQFSNFSNLLNDDLKNKNLNISKNKESLTTKNQFNSSQKYLIEIENNSPTKEKVNNTKKRKRATSNLNSIELKEKKKRYQDELKLERKRNRELKKQLQKLEKEEKQMKRREQNKIEKLNKLKTKLEACKEMIICLDNGFCKMEDFEDVQNLKCSSGNIIENEDEDENENKNDKMDKKDKNQNKTNEIPPSDLLEQKLKSLNVEVHYQEHPIPNTITWKRKVNYKYDRNLNIYKGTKKDYIINEEFVLLRISALDFAFKASSLKDIDLFFTEFKSSFINQLKNSPLDNKLLHLSTNNTNGLKRKRWIFIVEGLNDYYRKRNVLENRKMREIMKSQLTPNRPKRHKKEVNNENNMRDIRSYCGVDMGKYIKLKGSLSNYPTQNVLEEAFLWLQMTGECLIIFSSGWDKTVEWICTFTKEIAITPFKNNIEHSNNYCTYNKIRTEVEYSKIWYRMLEEVYRISPTIIEGIMKEYPTVFSLYKKYQEIGSEAGESLLENLEITSSNGNVRKIGKSISKRIYEWFTDENGNHKAI